MKKTISFVLAIAVAFFACSTEAQAESQLEKARKKEYKAKIKQYNKEGWKLYASPRTLEVELLTYYNEMDSKHLTGISGTVSRVLSKSTGHQACLNQAAIVYANNAGKYIKGRVTSDAGVTGMTTEEFEHFYGAYESLVEKEIKGELKEMFTVYRQIDKDNAGKPVFEMESYFLVDENAATQARIRAFENAAKESAAAQKYSKQISKFIKEGFEVK